MGIGCALAFDKANRLESVTDWSGHKTSFGYDADSDLTSTTFPSGTSNVDEYGYDRADRVASVLMKKGEVTSASLAYTRDPMGQIEKEEQSGLPGSASTSFGYTTLNQLSSAGSSAYSYDSADNMTKLAGASAYGYDEANELKSTPSGAPEGPAALDYNSLGERTELNPESGPTIKYDYDQADRLTSIDSESHAYGGDGLRMSTTTGEKTQHFSWDRNGGVPLLLTDGSTRYIYGPGGLPVEQLDAEGVATYYPEGDIGVTGTGGPRASVGTPSATTGPAVQISNANHVSELAGPFVHGGGQAAAGAGGFAQGFAGKNGCNESIVGLMAGPVAGVGYGAEGGATGTIQASTSISSIGHAIGHAVGDFFTPHVFGW